MTIWWHAFVADFVAVFEIIQRSSVMVFTSCYRQPPPEYLNICFAMGGRFHAYKCQALAKLRVDVFNLGIPACTCRNVFLHCFSGCSLHWHCGRNANKGKCVRTNPPNNPITLESLPLVSSSRRVNPKGTPLHIHNQEERRDGQRITSCRLQDREQHANAQGTNHPRENDNMTNS